VIKEKVGKWRESKTKTRKRRFGHRDGGNRFRRHHLRMEILRQGELGPFLKGKKGDKKL